MAWLPLDPSGRLDQGLLLLEGHGALGHGLDVLLLGVVMVVVAPDEVQRSLARELEQLV